MSDPCRTCADGIVAIRLMVKSKAAPQIESRSWPDAADLSRSKAKKGARRDGSNSDRPLFGVGFFSRRSSGWELLVGAERIRAVAKGQQGKNILSTRRSQHPVAPCTEASCDGSFSCR